MNERDATDGGDGDAFVSVAEASQLLDLSERQVRRYAGRLEPRDRQGPDRSRTHDRQGPDATTGATPDTGRTLARPEPMRFRLDALRQLAGRPAEAGQEPDATPDTGRTFDRQGPDMGRTPSGEVLVDQLRGEVRFLREELAFMRSALEREQQNTASALQRLEDAERRSAVLIAATATGRLPRLSAESDQSDEQFEQVGTVSGDSGAVSGPEATEPVPAPQTVQNRPTEASGGDTDKAPEPPQRLVGNEETYDPIYRQQEQKTEQKRRGWWPWRRKDEGKG